MIDDTTRLEGHSSTDNIDDDLVEVVPVEETPAESTYEIPAGKEPNVQLAPSAKEKALNQGLTNIGRHGVVLPDTEAQMGGFYTEHAGVLVAQFPQYKFIQKKGEKNAQSVHLK